MLSAKTLIEQLELQPHPEGGHYRETYRASEVVETPRGPRAASTAILYLLVAGEWCQPSSEQIRCQLDHSPATSKNRIAVLAALGPRGVSTTSLAR